MEAGHQPDVQLQLVAFNHQLHRLRPTLDDLVGSKRAGRTSAVRAIELRAVNEEARILRAKGNE